MEGDTFDVFSPLSYQRIAEVGRSLRERATTLFSPKTPSEFALLHIVKKAHLPEPSAESRSREILLSPYSSPLGTPSRDELNDLRVVPHSPSALVSASVSQCSCL
jgi:hypothetical protein